MDFHESFFLSIFGIIINLLSKMKKSLFISIFLFIFMLATAFVLLTAGKELDKMESEKPQVLSMTASVDIPEKMTFAGEEIIFDRYDKHERMDRELNSFTYFHSTTMLLFKRANRLFPIIEPILKSEGVPDDLKYLAVIESSLDWRAVSPANAVGLWQFMQETGRENGLEIRTDVDERYHVEKSTFAACKYLKDAYRRNGSWSAAAMEYNGGQGRISNALRNQRAEEALDLWLVEETTRYYFRMLAIKQIFEHPKQYGFVIKAEHLYKPMTFNKVTIENSIPDLVAFAKQNNITYAQLKDFNSWLRSDKLNNNSAKTYSILIPTKDDLYYKSGDKPKVHSPIWVIE